MSERTTDGPDEGTVRLVRNVLALLVSSAIMAAVGLPVMLYDYRSGVAVAVGTAALILGLAVAAWVALSLLDVLEGVAESIVGAFDGSGE
jgi:hypothetical protein